MLVLVTDEKTGRRTDLSRNEELLAKLVPKPERRLLLVERNDLVSAQHGLRMTVALTRPFPELHVEPKYVAASILSPSMHYKSNPQCYPMGVSESGATSAKSDSKWVFGGMGTPLRAM